MERKISKEQVRNIRKMIVELRTNPGGLWVREIARRCGIHMETARRIIERHPQIFREYADFTAYRINLKIIALADKKIDENNFLKVIGRRGVSKE
ncbi:MAG: hypothetical protein U9Q92_04285 [archaeon]|nr:hypothetical protein [archaeon]